MNAALLQKLKEKQNLKHVKRDSIDARAKAAAGGDGMADALQRQFDKANITAPEETPEDSGDSSEWKNAVDPDAPTPQEESFADKLNKALGGQNQKLPPQPKNIGPKLTPEQIAANAKLADARQALAKANKTLAILQQKGQPKPAKPKKGGGDAFNTELMARMAAMRGANKPDSDEDEEPASPEEIAAAQQKIAEAQAVVDNLIANKPAPAPAPAPAPPPPPAPTPLPGPPRGGKQSKFDKAEYSLADMKSLMEMVRGYTAEQVSFTEPGPARGALAMLVRGLTKFDWNLNELTVLARYASSVLADPKWNDYMADRLGQALSKEDPEPFHLTGLIELYNAPGIDQPSIHKLVLDVLDHGAATWSSEDWADAYGEFYVAGSDWYDYAQDAATNWIKVRREEGDVTPDDEAKIEEFITQFGLDDLRAPAAGGEDDELLQLDLDAAPRFQYGANVNDMMAMVGQMAERSKTVGDDVRAEMMADPSAVAAIRAINPRLKGEPADWPEAFWQDPRTKLLMDNYKAAGSFDLLGTVAIDPNPANDWVQSIEEYDPVRGPKMVAVRKRMLDERIKEYNEAMQDYRKLSKEEKEQVGPPPPRPTWVDPQDIVKDAEAKAIIQEWEAARPAREADLLKRQATDVRKALAKMGRNDLMAKTDLSDAAITGLLKTAEFREAVAEYNEERKLRYTAKATGSVALNDAIRDADESSKLAGKKWMDVVRKHPEYATEMAAKYPQLILKAKARGAGEMDRLNAELDLLVPGLQDRNIPLRVQKTDETLTSERQFTLLNRAGFRPKNRAPKKLPAPEDPYDPLVGQNVQVTKAVKGDKTYIGVNANDTVLVTATGKSNYYVVKTKPDGTTEEGWVPKSSVQNRPATGYAPPTNKASKMTGDFVAMVDKGEDPFKLISSASTSKSSSKKPPPKPKAPPGPPPPDAQTLLSGKHKARDSGSKTAPPAPPAPPAPNQKPPEPPGPAPPETKPHEPPKPRSSGPKLDPRVDDDDNPVFANMNAYEIAAYRRNQKAIARRQEREKELAKARAIEEANEAKKPKPAPAPPPKPPSPRPGPTPEKTPAEVAAEVRQQYKREERERKAAEAKEKAEKKAAKQAGKEAKKAAKAAKKEAKREKAQEEHEAQLEADPGAGPSTSKPKSSNPETQALMDQIGQLQKTVELLAAQATPIGGGKGKAAAQAAAAAGAYVPNPKVATAPPDPAAPVDYGSIPGGGGGGGVWGGGGGGGGWSGY